MKSVILALMLAAAAAPPPEFRTLEPDPGEAVGDIIVWTNGFRTDHGLGAVRESPRLDAVARDYAEFLARSRDFSHTADGRDPAQRALAGGYDYCEVAENLALSQDPRTTQAADLAGTFVRGWEASPGHRRNMLLPSVTETGVAVARSPIARGRYIAVQMFGRPGSMRYDFRITNLAGRPVTYAFDGADHSLRDRESITYTTCASTPLAVLGERFDPKDGAVYVVRPSASGALKVDVQSGPVRPST